LASLRLPDRSISTSTDLYNRVADHVRRDLLGAMFAQLVIHADDGTITVDSERTEVNAALHQWEAQRRAASADRSSDKKRAPRIPARGSLSLSTSMKVSLSNGLNILQMVGMTGFEPATP
jgi:site-specific DNA recombinase